jgi:hypothetical protein
VTVEHLEQPCLVGQAGADLEGPAQPAPERRSPGRGLQRRGGANNPLIPSLTLTMTGARLLKSFVFDNIMGVNFTSIFFYIEAGPSREYRKW